MGEAKAWGHEDRGKTKMQMDVCQYICGEERMESVGGRLER
jgi:hypothetical protein